MSIDFMMYCNFIQILQLLSVSVNCICMPVHINVCITETSRSQYAKCIILDVFHTQPRYVCLECNHHRLSLPFGE